MRPKGLHRQLYVQVLAAIVLGGLIGHFFPATGEAMKPLGDALHQAKPRRTDAYSCSAA